MRSGDSMPPRDPPALAEAGLSADLARLMQAWSLEATQPKPTEIEALRDLLLPGTQVYLSAPPHAPCERLVEHARRVSLAGFEPVPHLAVRNFPSRAALAEFLAGVHSEGSVRRVLAIAGDRDAPAGPFASSLQLIESGLLQDAGIPALDIAGYPDGHAKIPFAELGKALRAKVHAARSGGLEVQVVTQFSFDAKSLLSWLRTLRYEFPELPVRVGLAGPAGAPTLLKYALRCGVRATARGLGRGLSLIGNLAGDRTPLRMVRTLAEGGAAQERSGVRLHFYAFGGTAKTATWARALASGEIGAEQSER